MGELTLKLTKEEATELLAEAVRRKYGREVEGIEHNDAEVVVKLGDAAPTRVEDLAERVRKIVVDPIPVPPVYPWRRPLVTGPIWVAPNTSPAPERTFELEITC